jgi:hypothetical protein
MSVGRVYVRVLGIEAGLDMEWVLAGTLIALRSPLAAVALWRELPVLRANRRRAAERRTAGSPSPASSRERAATACPGHGRQLRRPRRAKMSAGPRRRPLSC